MAGSTGFGRFEFDRTCVRKLAGQAAMQRALAPVAAQVVAAARAGDPRGNYHSAPVVTNLANLSRAGHRVQDTTPDATRREWGTGRTPGSRTLGRIAGRVR